MNIGLVIRDARKKRGLSQMEVGLRTGYAQQTICNIERGNQSGGFHTIADILNSLGLDLRVVKL